MEGLKFIKISLWFFKFIELLSKLFLFLFLQKLKYPKSIAFIVSNEFCERFNYYGMRSECWVKFPKLFMIKLRLIFLIIFFSLAILVLYMTIILGYNDNTAVVLFHVFTSLVYFFPLMGAIIADSFLGKYR